MAYEVRLSRQALKDLRHIYTSISAESSIAADDWFRGLESAIFSLEELPQRSPRTPENGDIYHLLYGSKPHVYRIIYTVREDASIVNIAQIRHGARRPFRTLNR